MPNHRTVFNHVGLCVADCKRSRRFYEGLLGFQFWWNLELPDEGTIVLPPGVTNPQYVWHCHILEHEENDMMRAFEVVRT